jgi:hypothetical protein
LKKIVYIFFVYALLLGFASCKKDNMYDCFKTTGPIETRIREIPGFKSIELEDHINLYLTQGPVFEVKVQAGKHLHMNIATEVRDSVLHIENKNRCNWVRSPKKRINVYVTLPYLHSIRNNGVGSIYFENEFVQDTIRTRISNSGDMHIRVNVGYLITSVHGNGDLFAEGKAIENYNYTNGTNFVHLEDLTVQSYIFIETYSVGHCYINAPVNGPIVATMWRSGNIYYKGTPTSITLYRNGKGDLIKE